MVHEDDGRLLRRLGKPRRQPVALLGADLALGPPGDHRVERDEANGIRLDRVA